MKKRDILLILFITLCFSTYLIAANTDSNIKISMKNFFDYTLENSHTRSVGGDPQVSTFHKALYGDYYDSVVNHSEACFSKDGFVFGDYQDLNNSWDYQVLDPIHMQNDDWIDTYYIQGETYDGEFFPYETGYYFIGNHTQLKVQTNYNPKIYFDISPTLVYQDGVSKGIDVERLQVLNAGEKLLGFTEPGTVPLEICNCKPGSFDQNAYGLYVVIRFDEDWSTYKSGDYLGTIYMTIQ